MIKKKGIKVMKQDTLVEYLKKFHAMYVLVCICSWLCNYNKVSGREDSVSVKGDKGNCIT